MRVIKISRIFLILSAALVLFTSGRAAEVKRPSREYKVYFENTPNELGVYRLYGRFDGKTIFILGGIQGDEPGGYLSADLYPDLVLEKGNLIVVPRANFRSIILNNRGVNGDMNRRFDQQAPADIEDQIVTIIKQLMSESDLFLNLHDGSGFYRDTYVDEDHNPRKYGQSIIADASLLIYGQDTLKLEEMARKVIARVNERIEIQEHKFHFMNTNTLDKNTQHAEQRKSATYYAVTNLHIPAFGIESSKSLNSLELKIRYHNYAINEFFKLMGIEPEHPAVLLEPPKLIYVLVSINGSESKIVENEHTLELKAGDVLRVNHIEANYNRGISCDIVGLGTEQDFQKPVAIIRPTTIVVRRDNQVIGKIKIETLGEPPTAITYLIEVNNTPQKIGNEETLNVRRGDKIRIVDVYVPGTDAAQLEVNLKGYAPLRSYNNGEDRDCLIDTQHLNWKKYSVDGKGKKYPIVVSLGAQELTRAYVNIQD